MSQYSFHTKTPLGCLSHIFFLSWPHNPTHAHEYRVHLNIELGVHAMLWSLKLTAMFFFFSIALQHSGCFCYPQTPNETQPFQSVSAEIPNCWDQDIYCQVPPPMPQLQTKMPAGLGLGTGGWFHVVFDWATHFFYPPSNLKSSLPCPVSCLGGFSDGFIWHPTFFISSFVSVWIFFRESISTFMTWMFPQSLRSLNTFIHFSESFVYSRC